MLWLQRRRWSWLKWLVLSAHVQTIKRVKRLIVKSKRSSALNVLLSAKNAKEDGRRTGSVGKRKERSVTVFEEEKRIA